MTYVVGASAVTGRTRRWRGIAEGLIDGSTNPPLLIRIDERELPDRARRLMSKSAQLAVLAMRQLLEDANWTTGREETGCYLGVGASTGEMAELVPVLRESSDGSTLSLSRLGTAGLAACNPLLTFQLLNNFTLCHPAILEGLGGPNAAFFSRGGGTVVALDEALWAIEEQGCDRAIAGGSDCATHPVTLSELEREALLSDGLVPSDAAALLALSSDPRDALARIEHRTLVPGGAASTSAVLKGATSLWTSSQRGWLVLAPSGDRSRRVLLDAARSRGFEGRTLDISVGLGEALAASPAVAWVVGLDMLASGRAERVGVLSAGIDGDLGVVALSRSGT